MLSQNPRNISTEGLLIEGYLLKLRGLELLCNQDKTDAFIKGLIRRDQINQELDRRELVKRRAM